MKLSNDNRKIYSERPVAEIYVYVYVYSAVERFKVVLKYDIFFIRK